MGIRIETVDGRDPFEGVKGILDRVVSLMEGSGEAMSRVLSEETKSHFAKRFPGSSHFSQDKVSEGASYGGDGKAEGSAEIAAAGASRAYHDVTIRPVTRKALTIPMHSSAFGRSPAETSGLFTWKSKGGSAFLAKEEGGGLVLMWLLAKEAFQPKDESVMPSDETLGNALMKAISERI